MQQTQYTNRQIWHIAYPILISLIMEQMIGMTDTAFLGRVGEVELGASAIAGVFYMVIFMVAFGVRRYSSPGAMARKTTKPSANCSTTASTSRCAWPP